VPHHLRGLAALGFSPHGLGALPPRCRAGARAAFAHRPVISKLTPRKPGQKSHRKIIGKVVSAGDGTIFCGDLILTFSSFEQAMTSPSSLPASTPACRQSGSPARQGIWPASARRRSSRVALVPLETQAFKQTRLLSAPWRFESDAARASGDDGDAVVQI